MWSWNETVFEITFVTSARSDLVFQFVPALLSIPGMTLFFTSGSFQQGLGALGAAEVFSYRKSETLCTLVVLGWDLRWCEAPAGINVSVVPSLWMQDHGVSLSIGSLGKFLPHCKRIYSSNKSLNCAEIILRALCSSQCNSWKKKFLCTFHSLQTGRVMATTGCIFLWEVG